MIKGPGKVKLANLAVLFFKLQQITFSFICSAELFIGIVDIGLAARINEARLIKIVFFDRQIKTVKRATIKLLIFEFPTCRASMSRTLLLPSTYISVLPSFHPFFKGLDEAVGEERSDRRLVKLLLPKLLTKPQHPPLGVGRRHVEGLVEVNDAAVARVEVVAVVDVLDAPHEPQRHLEAHVGLVLLLKSKILLVLQIVAGKNKIIFQSVFLQSNITTTFAIQSILEVCLIFFGLIEVFD